MITSLPTETFNEPSPTNNKKVYKTDALEIWCKVKNAKKLQLHLRSAFALQKPPPHIGHYIPLGKIYAKLQVTEMVLHNKFLQNTTAIHVTGMHKNALPLQGPLYEGILQAKTPSNFPLFLTVDQGVDEKSPGIWLFTTNHYEQAVQYLETTIIPQYKETLTGTSIPINQKVQYAEPVILYHRAKTNPTSEVHNTGYSKILLQRRLQDQWDYDEDSLLQEAQVISKNPRRSNKIHPP